MARSASGIHGAFTGRIGNVVYYMFNGKQVARIIPSGMPKATGARKKAQEEFAHVMRIMKSIIDYIRIGYHDVSVGSMAFQAALSVNLKRMRATQNPEDLQWLMPSQGSRAGAHNPTMQRNGDQATVTWGEPTAGRPWNQRDMAMLLAINTSTLANTSNTTTTRSTMECTFTLPPATENERVVVFLSFYDPLSMSSIKDTNNISEGQLVEEEEQ